MLRLSAYIILVSVLAGCMSSASPDTRLSGLVAGADTSVPYTPDSALKPYSSLTYKKVEVLNAAPGTKSVLFNGNGSRLYAMNLEGMSLYEFDQPSRKVIRELKFKPTRGTGWDYEKDVPIASFEEKPVEACLTHDDRFLWVSLHNAEGIVPIRVDSLEANRRAEPIKDTNVAKTLKRIRVTYPGSSRKDSFDVPLVKTGKTPKIISKTPDDKFLLVSNWHSYNVSVLETQPLLFPFAKLVTNVKVPSIPRGIAVSEKLNRSFVCIMGGATISVINNSVWMKEGALNVESNPRHIVLDSSGRLFVSYNRLAKIACVDAETGKTLFTAPTHSQPRTIILSKNQKFLFVTCYSGDFVDVFKINENGFQKVSSLPCKGHPVGVDIFESDDLLEAWVCSYSNGRISVFSFEKR